MSHVMSVSGLAVNFGDVAAVRDISLHVDAGEILVVLGPNGAGKTTTTETLLGFRRPSAGAVSVFGVDPYLERDTVTRSVGALLQRGGVWAPMTPREVLELTASYFTSPRPPRDIEERLGLGAVAHTPWRRLSGGEQQRTLLGLAIIGAPRALVLDEPTAAVDPEGHRAIRTILGELRDEGCAILVTTHELADAEEIADRIVIVKDGRVAAQGTLDELQGEPVTVVEAHGVIDTNYLSRALVRSVTPDGRQRVRIGGPALAVSEVERVFATAGLTVTSVRTRATLEERYLDIVRDEVGL